jgi:23S rRNA (guanosine2251-2'-O)-methyltransferase
MIVILYNIRSSYNVGSIFRTADGAGVEKIYLCGITPAPKDRFGNPNKKIIKVSLGAEKNVAFEKVNSAYRLILKLKKEGYKILALEQSKSSQNIFKFKPRKKEKYALILGGEVKGLPKSILEKSDKILEIPQKGKKESLNVAVAFGIAVFYLSFFKI